MNYEMMSLDELKRYAEPVTELEKALFKCFTDDYVYIHDCPNCLQYRYELEESFIADDLENLDDEIDELKEEVKELKEKNDELTKELEGKS